MEPSVRTTASVSSEMISNDLSDPADADAGAPAATAATAPRIMAGIRTPARRQRPRRLRFVAIGPRPWRSATGADAALESLHPGDPAVVVSRFPLEERVHLGMRQNQELLVADRLFHHRCDLVGFQYGAGCFTTSPAIWTMPEFEESFCGGFNRLVLTPIGHRQLTLTPSSP